MESGRTTRNAKQTQKLGERFAKKIKKNRPGGAALVLLLQGELGSGKTTFLQGFARGMGIKEKILSPTFVIMKRFGNFYHIDCYRLKNKKDILELGFARIIENPENIVAIEWPEKIGKSLFKTAILIKFEATGKSKREITFIAKTKVI